MVHLDETTGSHVIAPGVEMDALDKPVPWRGTDAIEGELAPENETAG
jgi:hypothetical protein